VEIPVGKETGWHKHPVPLFGYVVSGTLTVYFADGKKNTFHPGDALAEAVNVVHNGINEGKDPVKLIIFVAGEQKIPFTIKEPNPGEMVKSPEAPAPVKSETKP
jgi:quercetin dioxygenase-like cupin family protein